jgi:HEAT repeat protein
LIEQAEEFWLKSNMPAMLRRPALKGRPARIWLSVAGIVVLSALIWWWRYAHQPTWHGKTVAILFADFRAARLLHTTNHFVNGRAYKMEDVEALFNDQASEGLRALGPDAVRWLGTEVQRGDGFWVRIYRRRYASLPAMLRSKLPAPSSRTKLQADAAMALAAIGTNATPAFPAVAEALGPIAGFELLPFFSPLQKLPLREGDLDPALKKWSRNRAGLGLELLLIDSLKLRTAAAASCVTNALLAPSATNSAFLPLGIGKEQAWSLVPSFKAHAGIIVPVLTSIILEGDQTSRSEAARLLADFRPGNRLAIPTLLQGARLGNLDCIRALRSLPVDSADLNRLLNDLVDSHQDRVAVTLATGLSLQTPLAIQVLTNSLCSESPSERDIAVAGVYRLSAQAEMVLPTLIGLLNHRDLAVRSQSVHILQQWGSRAAPALPALIAALKDGDADFRYDVIYALQSMGTNAVPALLELKKATLDENTLVRAGAKHALDALGQ